MYSDLISCVIYILNKVEYLEKEESWRNCVKEVTLSFEAIFAMQSINSWAKFSFIGTLKRNTVHRIKQTKSYASCRKYRQEMSDTHFIYTILFFEP